MLRLKEWDWWADIKNLIWLYRSGSTQLCNSAAYIRLTFQGSRELRSGWYTTTFPAPASRRRVWSRSLPRVWTCPPIIVSALESSRKQCNKLHTLFTKMVVKRQSLLPFFIMTNRKVTTEWIIMLILSGDVTPFYNTRAWGELRDRKRKAEHYECERCRAKGKYKPGKVVHHKKYLRYFS